MHLYRWSRALLLIIGLGLTGCARAAVPPTSPPTSSRVPSATATTPAATITPRPSPLPEPTLAPSPVPSATPTIPTVAPIATGFQFWITGWSPNGGLLAFRSFTPDDALNNPVEGSAIAPYGTLHLLDVQTGAQCEYAKDNTYGLEFNLWHAWLPDGRLMVLNHSGQVVALAEPCDGQSAALLEPPALPACLVTNPDSNQTCSPDGRRLAITDETVQPHTTSVLNTATGAMETQIVWAYSQTGIGHIGGPRWIDADRFVIHASDEGPLLVTLDGEKAVVQPIAPTYFGRPGTATQVANGVLLAGGADFHLLLQDQNETLLYHSDGERVEGLPQMYTYFSPDGRWLDLRDFDLNEAWTRPVDPYGSDAVQYVTPKVLNYPGWTDDGSRVALARRLAIDPRGLLTIYTMPTRTLLQSWALGPFELNAILWAPDMTHLAVIGYTSGGQQALFLLAPIS